MKSEITLLPLDIHDISEVIGISDELFGKGYMSKSDFLKYIDTRENLSLVARLNGKIVGFQLMQIVHEEGFFELALGNSEWFEGESSRLFPVGVLKSVAVSVDSMRKGVATALTIKSLEVLKEKSKGIISVLWDQNGKMPVAKILERCGMRKVHKIEGFWSQDSRINGYSCRICGAPPCKCDAHIYEC